MRLLVTVGLLVGLLAGINQPTSAAEAYSDVDPQSGHAGDIETLKSLGVFQGTECSEGRFCPADPVSRWVMAVWMIRVLEGADPHPQENPGFGDVADTSWWKDHVNRLLELGVTRGCQIDPARYCPHQSVTRSQMASFLVRAFGFQWDGEAGFVDTGNSSHAGDINVLFGAGVTRGCAVNPVRFCPDDFVTRAQMASFLNRAQPAGGAGPETTEEPLGSTDNQAGGGSGGGGSGSGGGGGGSRGGSGGGGSLTPGPPPPPPWDPHAPPQNLVLMEGHQQLQVSWQHPAGHSAATTTYQVRYRDQMDSVWTQHPGTVSPVVITDLTNGRTYDVRVTPFASEGEGASATGVGTPRGFPGEPRDLQVERQGDGMALSWNPPSNDGGYPVTGYLVTYLREGDNEWQTHAVSTGSPTIVTSFVEGETYLVSVGAVNHHGVGKTSLLDVRLIVPTEPRNLGIAVGAAQDIGWGTGGKLIASWDEPAQGSPITEYHVQWRKTDGEDFDPTTRQITTEDTTHTLTDLDNRVEYQVRVLAANFYGTGTPTDSIPGTPLSAPAQLKNYILEHTTDVYGDHQPWIENTLDNMAAVNAPLVLWKDMEAAGLAPYSCSGHLRPFRHCKSTEISIRRDFYRDRQVIVHELAHAYTLSTWSDSTAAVGMGWMFFHDLAGGVCPAYELYAATFEALTRENPYPYYWGACSITPNNPTEEAIDLIRAVGKGIYPDWFAEQYQGGDGVWDRIDMEAVWSDASTMSFWNGRIVTVYTFRSLFGGYCDPVIKASNDSPFGPPDVRNTVTNPWKDGGCVPDAVNNLTLAEADQGLEVSWETPDYGGGAAITQYIVRWKSGDQDYDSTRQFTLDATDLTDLRYTIPELVNDRTYTVSVSAVNRHYGEGASSEATGTPRD